MELERGNIHGHAWRGSGWKFLMVALLALAGASAAQAHGTREPALPIVFVHGFNGSGAQYEAQAMRWASNDYPNIVTAIDRTSTTPAVIYPMLDAFFDDLMARTGDSQVYVLGHSAGTAVMGGYLNSSPERAARVAKYIGLDGATAATCPGGVPCKGIWARGNAARALGPDNNVQFAEQGHTEVVGSAESFVEQYKFFTGREPRTTQVLPEFPSRVKIAGRVLNYPANTGLQGATLRLWKVNRFSGARVARRPQETLLLGADGNFGPFRVDGDDRYEISITRPEADGGYTQHFYYEPFLRSNYLLRLNLSPPDSTLSQAIERGPSHGSVSIVRQKEWWGNHPVESDALYISALSRSTGWHEPVNIVTGATAPVTGSTIAVISFDAGSDGVTHTDALVPLGAFLSGVDFYYPASTPPDGTISFVHVPRMAEGLQVINTPNWASAEHGMTVTFRNWTQEIDSWAECVLRRHSPCRQ